METLATVVAAAVGTWLNTEEDFNTTVVEDITLDVEDIVGAVEATPTKLPLTVAVEADFEAVMEFIAMDVEALHQIAMMPLRDCVSTAAALTT